MVIRKGIGKRKIFSGNPQTNLFEWKEKSVNLSDFDNHLYANFYLDYWVVDL